ncbi:hypothetical protein DVH24_009444 [Malus domestica]|uniref:Pentatricopeptide repeat-containing protein n=1 Tax=Malus domestica TaxID=3750 RepID=A0A498IW32_MALDO|nr:hypothetical protein DVH24_009444 [Malus domestica]
MYLNSQGKIDATILFSEFPKPKSKILWTAMISGLSQNDCSKEALQLYREMRSDNALPDQATFASVLRACAVISSLKNETYTDKESPLTISMAVGSSGPLQQNPVNISGNHK